jgi:hypothetical protein
MKRIDKRNRRKKSGKEVAEGNKRKRSKTRRRR